MSFTNAWTEVSPGDGDARKYAAQEIRKLRLDIRERMNALAATDWTADPLVLLPAVSGLNLTKYRYIHHSGFDGGYINAPIGGSDVQYARGYDSSCDAMVVGAGQPMYAQVGLPVGVTIIGLDALVDTNTHTSDTTTLDFYTLPFSASPTRVTLVSLALTGTTGKKIVSSGVLSHLVADELVWIKLTSGNIGHLFYGCRVAYSTPSHLNTL